jgi:Mn2+/Fe2+ NRAMP family transporter
MNYADGSAMKPSDEWNIAVGDLPPLQTADLPPLPPSTWKIIGPGLVAAGVGLGASEFILFPFIASQVGLSLLWAACLVILMQWVMIMEVERYALATGETVLTGFSRLARFWGPVMCLMGLAIAAWPGWATSAATLLTFLFGGSVKWWTLGLLLAIGVTLTLSRTAYRSLERAEVFKVAAVAIFFVGSLASVVPAETLARVPASLVSPSFPVAELGWPMVLGALAFAGTGANAILCQANWIRDKGFGMGVHAPRIVSPILGTPVAAPGTGWRFELSPRNIARWQAWWRFANAEQLITFVLICIVTITLTSVLAYSLLFGRPDLPSDINFVALQGRLLAEQVGVWFAKLFWAVGAIALFATALGLVDITGRTFADVIRTSYRPHADESRIYAIVVWSMLAFGSAVVLSGITQPVLLLVLSGSISGVMMFLIAGLLIRLNRKLPGPLAPSGWRIAALAFTVLFFIALASATVADRFGLL